MSLPSRSQHAADGRDVRGTRRDGPSILARRSLVARLDCGEYLVRAIPQGPDDEGRSFVMVPWNYRPTARTGPEPIIVSELEDPEEGCHAPGYEGLACSCSEYSARRPCDHVVELVALGLIRPAPSWPDEVLDLVQLPAFAGDE